jgi:RNA-directed DNA polymerase
MVRPHNAAHGFVMQRSIVSNAKSHLKSAFVLNVDLKDFFPTISFRRVRGMLIAPPFGLTPLAATCIARIACHKGQLPMGSPCSPVISNALCRRLDQQMKELCKSLRCWYTRYADDITISSRAATFPTDLADSIDGPLRRVILSQRLISIVRSNGFEIQDTKTRLQDSRTRQVVTGVIVNKKLGLDRRRRNQVRAMLYAWEKHGYDAAEREFQAKYDKKHRPGFKKKPSYRYVLGGKLEYLKMVLGADRPQIKRLSAHFEQLVKALQP